MQRTFTINAPLIAVWDALATGAGFSAWSNSETSMDETEGGAISLWGGQVIGKNLKINPQKELTQEWDFGWEEPSLATFTFSFDELSKTTKVELRHSNVPSTEYKDIFTGWDKEVFDPIKDFLKKD